MLTITLPENIAQAVLAAANRQGVSVNQFVVDACSDVISLAEDRARVAAWENGAVSGVEHEKVDQWLAQLEQGVRDECPN